MTSAFTKDLLKIISEREEKNSADELIIQGGYASPCAVEALRALTNIKLTVIYGCQIRDGKRKERHSGFLYQNHADVDILFQEKYCHAKIYCWLKEGEVVEVLSGSANFSRDGLTHDGTEILYKIDSKDYQRTYEFLENNIANSTLCSKYEIKELNKNKQKNVDDHKKEVPQDEIGGKKRNYKILQYDPPKINLYLHDATNKNKFGRVSGYNKTSQVNKDDCELTISTKLIEAIPKFFPNDGINQKVGMGHGKEGKSKIPNATFCFEKDKLTMPMSFQGTTNKSLYKNLRSFPEGAVLGRYLRKKLGIDSGQKITKEILDKYGRDFLTITHHGGGDYTVDFG